MTHRPLAASLLTLALLGALPALSATAQAPPAPPAAANDAASAGPPLTLAAAITAALNANPGVHGAQQQQAQAEARVAQAQAQRRFQITFSSTGSGSSVDVPQPPPAHETFGTLQNTLSVPIPLGPRARLAVTQAQGQLAAAQAQTEGARFSLALQVTTAYYDLLRKQALRALAGETLDQAQRQVQEAQKRFRAGDVPELDVIRAQVPVAAAQTSQIQAENDVTVARQTLNGLMGRPLAAPLTIADIALSTAAASAALPYSAEEALSRALANSPDVRAADAMVRADTAAVSAARRYRDPQLALQASDTRSGDKTGFSRDDTVQAAITLPLSDGGLGKAQIREAEAALAQANAQAEAARRTVEVTVGAAYLTAESSRRQTQVAATARDLAQTSYDKTVRGYTGGLFPLSDVLNAQAALNQARIAYTQALYEAAAAASTLQATVNGAAVESPPQTPAAAPTTAAPAPGKPTTPGKP